MEARLGRPASPGDGHRVVVRDRQGAEITGVRHVASFDERQVVLETELGVLAVHGHDLRIRQLDLAQGTFCVGGRIDSLSYAAGPAGGGPPGPRRGLWGRLFR